MYIYISINITNESLICCSPQAARIKSSILIPVPAVAYIYIYTYI